MLKVAVVILAVSAATICQAQVCGHHEAEVDCVPVCEPTCADQTWRPLFPQFCAKGCICDHFNGFVRGPNGTCVTNATCNSITEEDNEFDLKFPPTLGQGICPVNELYVDCLPACQPTCRDQTVKPIYPDVCAKGCMCDVNAGYVMSEDGICVKSSTCDGDCDPTLCDNGGTCVKDPAGFHCECQPQYAGVHCEKNDTCGGSIDVHFNSSGDIQSPGYPFSGGVNQNCSWTLTDVDNIGGIGLIFAQVSGFRNNSCSGLNGLTFYGASNNVLTRLCYFVAPGPVRGLDNQTKLTIHWENENEPNAAFFLMYQGKGA